MRRSERKQARSRRPPVFSSYSWSYLLFFVLCFIYFWLVVEPYLIYYGFGTLLPDAPQFATGWPFLRDALGTPGGPVIYASAFLSQGFCHAWLGAAIIVLAGLCLAELSRRHLVRIGLARAWLLAPLPAIMLFLIYSDYNHPLAVCLAVSLGLLLSLIFEWVSQTRLIALGAVAWLPWRLSPAHIVAYCLLAMRRPLARRRGNTDRFRAHDCRLRGHRSPEMDNRRCGAARQRRDHLGLGRIRVLDPRSGGLSHSLALGAVRDERYR